MRAGPLVGSAGLDVPSVLAATGLGEIDSVRVQVAPGWMRRAWIGDVGAMTLGSRIYVDPAALRWERSRLGALLVHELVHVRQWRHLGAVRFLLRYVGDYLRGRLRGRPHREAYLAIRLEVEARAIAGR